MLNGAAGHCSKDSANTANSRLAVSARAVFTEDQSFTANGASVLCAPDLAVSSESSLTASLFAKLAEFAGRSKGLLALCDQGVVSLTNFLTGLIIGRVAGKNELGLYAVCWTLVTIATEVSAALITTPYTVFGPRMNTTQRSRYLGSMFAQQIGLSLIAAILMLLGMAVASFRGASGSLAHAITITATVIVFISLREFVRRICFAELKVLAAVVLDIVACIVQIAGMVLLWYTGRLTASAAYLLLGGLSMAVAVAWLFLNRAHLCLQRRYWIPGLQHNWSFAKWVLASGLLWASAMYLYPWFLTVFHGTAVTGVWAACYAIVAMGNPVLLGLGNYIGPKISNVCAGDGTQSMRRCVYRSSMQMGALLLPLVLVLLAFGGRIMTRMYGESYGGNGLVVTLLALNLLATGVTFPFSRGLFALRAARVDMLVNVVAVTLLFTFGIAAVKSHAAAGAATALLLTTIVTAAIRVSVFERAATRGTDPTKTAVLETGAVLACDRAPQ